jgi:hypothetical protein
MTLALWWSGKWVLLQHDVVEGEEQLLSRGEEGHDEHHLKLYL